ncbi:MAG: RagB/SusD family nutrient uptake outer membrane protein, partial [Bacteroidaceae bacterium]|nr:RagB/SusD family nutrient uptake outer membrane protein [Bacteroidaceae bacterium]
IKAEALFLRALCHFELVNIYAQPYLGGQNSDKMGVPVVLVSKIAQPERNTVGEVYAQVVEDLTEAESLMADGYQRADVTDVFATVTKEAIQALLSRVYLYMGEWQECANYATKVINSGKFSLYEPAKYKEMWTLNTAAKGGEVIFEMYASKKNDTWDGSGWEHLPYVTSPTGSADVCATNDLYDLYEVGDVRKEMFVANENDWFPTKYAGKVGSVDPKEANVPVLRLAEMYLNRAEALNNGATIEGASAINDLNAITSKRGASYVGATAGNIFIERRKELAFEGHIFFDYKRLGKSITRTDYRSTNKTHQNVEFPGNIWAMPIPKSEMEANPNMEQNPY